MSRVGGYMAVYGGSARRPTCAPGTIPPYMA